MNLEEFDEVNNVGQKVVKGEESPRFEDMEAVCEALGIDDEDLASMLEGEGMLHD